MKNYNTAWRQKLAAFFIIVAGTTFFRGAFFISAEFSDISFEVKAVLYLDFYAFGDVFRRSETVQQDRIVGNRFELARTIPEN